MWQFWIAMIQEATVSPRRVCVSMAPKERQPGGIPRVVPEIPGVGTAGEPCELRAWNRPPSIVGSRSHGNHGILILQLTEAYFKLGAQLAAQCQVDPDISQLSIWVVCVGSLCVLSAWGQSPADGSSANVRQPELIHVFVYGKDGPQIISWMDLMKDVELCNYAFGSFLKGSATDFFPELANNMGKDDQVTMIQTINQVQGGGPRAPKLWPKATRATRC